MGEIKLTVVDDDIVITFGNGAIFDVSQILVLGVRQLVNDAKTWEMAGYKADAQQCELRVQFGKDLLRKIEAIWGKAAEGKLINLI